MFFGLTICVSFSLTIGLGLESTSSSMGNFLGQRAGGSDPASAVRPTKPVMYVYMVSLEVRLEDAEGSGGWRSACVGALVAPHKVLTSASCYSQFKDLGMERWQLVAGRFILYEPRETEQIRGIGAVHIHESFESEKPYLPVYDYAVIVTNAAFELSHWVRSISMATPDWQLPQGESITAVGWELTEHLPEYSLEGLNQTLVPVEECQGIYDTIGYEVKPNLFCAGRRGEKPSNDMRGAPVVYDEAVLLAISTRPFVRNESYPCLYSNVSDVVPWIDQL